MRSSASEVPFTVDADLDLGPAAGPWLRTSGADVVVRRGPVPEALAGIEAEGAAWSCASRRFLVKPPGARFLVEGGNAIRYATEPGVDDLDVRLFLLGAPWSALVLQRGLLPLQASAVAVGRDVVGFVGQPGAGKSTWAAALAARGHGFFADDMLILDPASRGSAPCCWGLKDLKLWPDAVAMTGAVAGKRARTASTYGKRYAEPSMRSVCTSGRLMQLCVLIRRSADMLCRREELDGARAADTFVQALYHKPSAVAIAGKVQLFRWLLAIERNVKAWQLERSMLPSRFDESVARVHDALLS